ncbi:hypothetical protein H0H87_008041 [Tephrocybe sp. NHM501043]|nr:hypothetical protein H0H87_008041 [Tephrocybe sp. NHM501043]
MVEGVGNLTGATSWQQSGKQEHAEGETEYKSAQAKGYAEGTAERIGGKKDSIVGAVIGDRSQETQATILSDRDDCLLLIQPAEIDVSQGILDSTVSASNSLDLAGVLM